MNNAFSALAAALLLAACSGASNTGAEYKPVVTHTALLRTSMGDMEIELYGKDAPKTVENFVGLANKGYYNGILFHRVVPGFVIQAGDPLSKDPARQAEWGNGGESIYGATFADELDPKTPSYKRGYVEGAVAMANAGPNTNGSQFFIVLEDAVADRLPPNYTIFGFVRKGMEVAHKIENLPLERQSPGSSTEELPKTPVTIMGVTVTAQ